MVGLPVGFALLVAAASGRYISLHPDDGIDARFGGFFLKLPCAMHVAVIGDGECGLLELERTSDQVIDPICAVEEGVLGVAVKMNEGHTVRICRPGPAR